MFANTGLGVLPKLRQNLQLLSAPPDEDGEPRWQIFDPTNNKFYYLSLTALSLFRKWSSASNKLDLLSKLESENNYVSQNELDTFIQFLKINHLLEIKSKEDIAGFKEVLSQQKKHVLLWLLHNYLFIKLPLFRPDLLLTRLYPITKSLFSLKLHQPIFLLGLIGIFMVMRQWEVFTHTFQNMLNTSSILYYIIALVLVKSAHELGHALVAKRYGCRVSSMGVAFLLMTPILYTDTTDAWRLRSRFQRLSIVTAGVRVEIYIACLATFLWGIVPDGSLRNMLFFVATTSWISSLLINISPFMRFDGYYALSDFLGMENLQPRSFLVGKWFLRERLFGFGFSPPEPLNRKKCRLMVIYAWCTWVYRLFLFIGIAALVYYFTFKLLGIILFVVEIAFFVILPITKEMTVWFKLRNEMSLNRTSLVSILLFVLTVALLVIPWKSQVSVPAVITFERYITLYSSDNAEVISWDIRSSIQVEKDQILIHLRSAEIEKDIDITQTNLEQLNIKWQRSGVNAKELSSSLIIQTELARETSRLQGLVKKQKRLLIKAPFNGVIGQDASLTNGDFVNNKMPLATLYDGQSLIVKAYIRAQLISQIEIQKRASFVGNDGKPLVNELVIERVIPTAITNLNYLGLSSSYGGEIVTELLDEKEIPNEALYEVHLKVLGDAHLTRQQLGQVSLSIESESFILSGLQHIYGVFIKESIF